MGLLELILGLVVVGIVIGIFFVLAKKENEETDRLISNLTEQQISILKSSEVFSSNSKDFIFTAIIAKINDKGNKLALDLLYDEKVNMGPHYKKIVGAYSKITKAEQQKYNLKVGDFVKISINFEKCDVKVILD